ncbi:MAG: bifunctional DNA-formamidopyrimidine glycosylase/DNA-(apurinic or apyrimidinic site) lyase [Porticoccaceae bacterium]
MPELPEVETTRRGLASPLEGQWVASVVIRNPALRWPVPANLPAILIGQRIGRLTRRGKYLLAAFADGHLLLHLGMSGSLRMVPALTPADKHDHVDIVLASAGILRLTDPRRFGAVLWVEGDPAVHPLLAHLGPEPLEPEFDDTYLFGASRGRKTPIKNFLMDSSVVVGVGNIYANEALFMSGIHPLAVAGKLSVARYRKLVSAIREVLAKAITQGGTTLRNFVGGDGKPGYFGQELSVYGRAGLPCRRCGRPLKAIRLNQRATVYCPRCQR